MSSHASTLLTRLKRLAPLALAATLIPAMAAAQAAPDLTAASWTGWTEIGQSNQLGIWARNSQTEVYKIYTTVFSYAGGIAGTQPTGFATGNKILGIGVQRVSGTADYPILKFDFDGGSYAPASSLGGTDGKVSFGTFGTLGDAVIHHPPSVANGQPSEITIKASPTNTYVACGSFGCGAGLPGIRGARFAAGHLKMYYDLTQMPASYPTLGAIGNTVTIAINNGTNDCVVTVSTQIPTPNTAPVAVNDTYTMLRGGVLNVAAPGVIGNDTDAENNSLTATLVGNPSNGNVIVYGDGSFDYTPAPAFAGTDSFTYKVSDGVADSNTATVTITVDNLAPVAVADSYTMAEDTVLTVAAPGVLGNDSDGNSDPIQAVQLTSAANGNVALLLDGSFTYTPAANFFGTDSFTYKVTDGLLESAPVTVTITVNDVPDLIPVNTTGFFQPVDNLPTINRARAGRTVPLKFRVTNGSGVGIQVPGLAVAVTSALATSNVATEDAIETYTGNSGLQYLGDGYYQWNWATLSGYVNQTRRLTLSINAAGYSFSQAQLQADFRFTK